MKTSHNTRASRRKFLKQAGAAAMVVSGHLSIPRAFAQAAGAKGESKEKFSAIKNRAPLAPNAFYLLPLGAIRPTGWLRAQLRTQADGLSGHLDEIWPDIGPNSVWLGGTGESWERGPYYLDGLLPLAYLLDDPGLKAKAQKFIEWTLASQKDNGVFGRMTKVSPASAPVMIGGRGW